MKIKMDVNLRHGSCAVVEMHVCVLIFDTKDSYNEQQSCTNVLFCD